MTTPNETLPTDGDKPAWQKWLINKLTGVIDDSRNHVAAVQANTDAILMVWALSQGSEIPAKMGDQAINERIDRARHLVNLVKARQ